MRGVLTTAGELAGIGLVCFGIWLVFVPAAFIFGGLAVGFICFWLGRDK